MKKMMRSTFGRLFNKNWVLVATRPGEAVVEMVNTIHHGENRGSKPVILYMFYLS